MKPGDTVRFLNSVGGGVVSHIDGKTAYVVDPEDGFETPMPLNECIVVPGAAEQAAFASKVEKPKAAVAKAAAPAPKPQTAAMGFNVALIFEPQDIKRLSQTAFDLYLVNDTNYKLLYSVAAHDRLDPQWQLLDSGECEPCVQAFLGEVGQGELNRLENISVQLLALKEDADFDLVPPVGMKTRFDVTRLAKLHCFTLTGYSTEPVVTLPVVTNGKVHHPTDFSPLVSEPRCPEPPKVSTKGPKYSKPAAGPGEPEVIDLHIHELVDSTAGLQPADMLAHQLDVFDKKMKEFAPRHGKKVIFIHGKGDGVLRRAILDRLRRYYPKCEVQDASFLEYGFGATQVTIH